MGSQATSPSQIIALPKGGGAQKGLGEKFSPDLHTGTGNFTVPITLPPGRNGFQPQLSLVYSSGNGNGYFGLGWSLSIPGVMRKTSKGIPRYRDDDREPTNWDTFVLSGAEDLVPVEDSSLDPLKATRYRPRTEGLFAKIIHHYDAQTDTNYWEVRSKDGLISYYGDHPTERVAQSTSATITKPKISQTDPNRIFAWKLTLTQDPFGNRIEYLYADRDQSTTPDELQGRQWDQPLLTQIRYADYHESDQTKFLVTVSFQYEDRLDPFSDYRAGFEIRTTKRCKSILIETHADQTYKVRRYDFSYDNQAKNGMSFLTAVDVVGFDDAGTDSKELPPLEFGYSQFNPQDRTQRDLYPVEGADLPATSLANTSLELVDLYGNGLPDILEMNGTVRYWRNRGNGRFDRPRSMTDAPAGLSLSSPGVQLIDANGDGRTDLLVTQETLTGYYPLQFSGQWARRSFQPYAVAPSFDLKDPEVRLIDLTGDGVTDVLRSSTRFECFFNDPQNGWGATRRVERGPLKDFPNVNFSDPHVKWGDLSGDGLQDIVLIHDGVVDYWPNLGYGEWGKRLRMANSPRFPFGYDPRRILIGDVDGDGLSDLLYVEDRKVTLWINQSGNGWSAPIEILGTPPVSDLDATRVIDLLGSGISSVLWTKDATSARQDHYLFLDLTGGSKPYLLNEMNNNMGAITKVGYKPSTTFYLDDEALTGRRWRTPLPFPVQVVALVEVIDDVSKGKLTTEYRYHHGYWDGVEREFRGFGMVEQFDTERFEPYNQPGLHGASTTFEAVGQTFSPPTLTKTWFHQGPIENEAGDWHEQDWSNEYWDGDPPLLHQPERVDDVLTTLDLIYSSKTTEVRRRIKRDALRTLRGSILRTELYALDESPLQDRTYTVTEQAYSMTEVAGIIAEGLPHIFFPHSVGQRTTQWERGDDPMTQFFLTGAYDEFGQPLSHSSIAVPRRSRRRHSLSAIDVADETRVLATHSRTVYALPTSDGYLHDRVATTSSLELTESPAVTETAPDDIQPVLLDQSKIAQQLHDQFERDFDNWKPGKPVPDLYRIFAHTVNRYDGDAFVGLPVGQVASQGVPTRSETLVLTTDILAKAYGDRPLIDSSGRLVLPPGAPNGFETNLGYEAINSRDGYVAGFYIKSRQGQYNDKGLLIAQRDPLDHETTIDYDAFNVLPTTVTDPLKLQTKATYNYRVMQPKQVMDPNENVTEFGFSAIGLLTDTWVKGKVGGNEGDRTRPSTQLFYDFLAYRKSVTADPAHPQPVSVRTLRAIRHDSDPADTGETIETREYSDGFGRLLQSRAQGEDIRFGDPVFGGGELVLPAKQADGALADFAAQVLADRPVAYYRLNESAGSTTVLDSSGHAHHGKVSREGITLGVPGLGLGDTAGQFEAHADGRIVVPESALLSPPRITIEAVVSWAGSTVDPNGHPIQQRIVEKAFHEASPTWPTYGLSVSPDGTVQFQITIFNPQTLVSTRKITAGVPVHVAATYDGQTMRIYLDGVLDSSMEAPGKIHFSFGTQSHVGLGNEVGRYNPFKGIIDEIAIYDKALPPERIRAHVTPNAIIGQINADSNRPNVVVSGWQRYDNKGRVIEKFEPFYDLGWEFEPANDVQLGQKVTMVYDPRGQVIRTVNPDGSEQRVIYGIPVSLTDPPLAPTDTNKFSPTPWEAYTYDPNDLAPFSYAPKLVPGDPLQPLTNRAPTHHHYTPSNVLVDAMGRRLMAVQRNADSPSSTGIQELRTRSTYDIHGNLLRITDPLNRVAFIHSYDLAKRVLKIESIDAGLRQMGLNAVGNEVYRQDSKGALVLHAYDIVNRPIERWARDRNDQAMTLREHLHYGDGSNSNQADTDRATERVKNRLAKLVRHFDEAGLVTFDLYDFKGNLLEKSRQVINDSAIAGDWVADWNKPDAERAIDPTDYRTTTQYDALNRPTQIHHPADVNGQRAQLVPSYNRAGALEQVSLDGQLYVQQIAYNAKGQRALIAYGNGVFTRYAYDRQTFRLARLRTEHVIRTDDIYQPTGPLLQDFAYDYDLAGNILGIHDRVPGCGVPNDPDKLDRAFAYDAIYRLTEATGRECNVAPSDPYWLETPRCQDVTNTRPYSQAYSYDMAGNMTKLAHTAAKNGNFTRTFATASGNNRLNTVTVGPTVYAYQYDDNGNMTEETTSRRFLWDHADRLHEFQATAGATPSIQARYLYDSAGMRVKKWVRKSGTASNDESTVYIDGFYEHHRWQKNGGRQNTALHVMDNQSRVAIVRKGPNHPDDTGPAVQYHLGDHLGSSHLVIGGDTAQADSFINREEFFPYGETSFGSFGKKRYRFTGKERDEESGLNYHGARYYSPHITKWIAPDPAGTVDGTNIYLYTGNNFIRLVDRDGKQQSTAPVNGTNTEEDLGKFARDTKGFAQGKETPPEFNSRQGGSFGRLAHDEQPSVVREMKSAGYKGAERMYEGVRIDKSTGAVEGFETKPGGKGKLNFDLLFSDKKPTNLSEVSTTVDDKYGAPKVNRAQAEAGPRHLVVGDTVKEYGGTLTPRGQSSTSLKTSSTSSQTGNKIQGRSPGNAGFASLGAMLGMTGLALTTIALVDTKHSFDRAYKESERQDSQKPLEDEAIRQAGRWGAGLAGGVAFSFAVKGTVLGGAGGPLGAVAGFALGMAVGMVASHYGGAAAEAYIQSR